MYPVNTFTLVGKSIEGLLLFRMVICRTFRVVLIHRVSGAVVVGQAKFAVLPYPLPLSLSA